MSEEEDKLDALVAFNAFTKENNKEDVMVNICDSTKVEIIMTTFIKLWCFREKI